MKIAVIGGSGFVGTRLISFLIKDFEVINLDKRISDFYKDITIVGDVRDLEFLKKELKDFNFVVLLAAEHRDDVNPESLYYDVNVQGMKNVLEAMDFNGIKNILFTSTVAVYGLNKVNPNENHKFDPFNNYGKSKLKAEAVLKDWYTSNPESKSVIILRPTVIFGERNRGNVYNLLKLISSGKFLMVGNGKNMKSMAYVGNVAEFILFNLKNGNPTYEVYNYIDKPDLTMNELVAQVELSLDKSIPPIRLPYTLGLFGGYFFDVISKISNKKFPISAIRVKKFCSTTQFDSSKMLSSGFKPTYSLKEGLDLTLKYEFANTKKDEIIFESE